MAQIIIVQASERFGWFSRYIVQIDRQTLGQLAPGQSLTLDVEPGDHTVQVLWDHARSKALSLTLEQGQTVRLRSSRRRRWLFEWLCANPAFLMEWETLKLAVAPSTT